MTSDFKNALLKKAAISLQFYILAATVIFFLEKAAPSGPCTPGPGMMVLFLMPFTTFVLLAINVFKIYTGEKARAVSAIVHLSALLVYLISFTS